MARADRLERAHGHLGAVGIGDAFQSRHPKVRQQHAKQFKGQIPWPHAMRRLGQAALLGQHIITAPPLQAANIGNALRPLVREAKGD